MIYDYTAILIKKNQLTHDVVHLSLKLLTPPTINFVAGQYILLQIPDGDISSGTPYLRRQYSICSPEYEKDHIELVLDYVPNGVASEYIKNLPIGSEMLFQGPAGVFTLTNTDVPKVFLATGTGIAPIRSHLNTLLKGVQYKDKKIPLTLLWGVKTSRDTYFIDELKALKNEHPQFSFTVCLSRETDGDKLDMQCFLQGRVTGRIEKLIAPSVEYYICGGRDAVVTFIDELTARGVEKTRIFFEKF